MEIETLPSPSLSFAPLEQESPAIPDRNGGPQHSPSMMSAYPTQRSQDGNGGPGGRGVLPTEWVTAVHPDIQWSNPVQISPAIVGRDHYFDGSLAFDPTPASLEWHESKQPNTAYLGPQPSNWVERLYPSPVSINGPLGAESAPVYQGDIPLWEETYTQAERPSRPSYSQPYESASTKRGSPTDGQRCPHPECGRTFKDLKAHMLTHQNERPEKCPIQTCDYHVKGFARKYDKNRHTLTHYKGTMVCGFCPGDGTVSQKTFNRADVFKRHLTAVHGVEQTPPNSRKVIRDVQPGIKKELGPGLTGKCSTCSQLFDNAQDFYEHLDACVLMVVRQEDSAEAASINPALNDEDEEEDFMFSASRDLKVDDPDLDYVPKRRRKAPEISARVSKRMTHSTGRNLLKGTSNQSSRWRYPASWGFDRGAMTMKKRVMAVFDGPRRLIKDDLMLSEQGMHIKLSMGESFLTGLDVKTLNEAEEFLSRTNPSLKQTESKSQAVRNRDSGYFGGPGDEVEAAGDVETSEAEKSSALVVLPTTLPAPEVVSPPLDSKVAGFSILHGNQDESPPQVAKSSLKASLYYDPLVKTEADDSELEPIDEAKDVPVSTPTKAFRERSPAMTPSTSYSSLSSEASCSTGTGGASVVSSPHSVGAITNERKELIVKRILSWFKTWLDGRLAVLAYQCNGGEHYPSSSSSSTNNSPANGQRQGGQRRESPPGQKRPRGEGGETDDELDDGEGNDGGRDPKRVKREEADGLSFACPFLQRTPAKYQRARACVWGWKSVHRVKEHVYRKHRLPQFQCNRCRQEFRNAVQLSDHQRSLVVCEVQMEESQEGINDQQMMQLRSRKKPNGKLSEEEKWREAYRIIFPDEDLIPSPYHDPAQYQVHKDSTDSPTDANLLRDLGDHARRELPRLLRPRLEDMLDRVIEESLNPDRVVELAQGAFEQILQSFNTSIRPRRNSFVDVGAEVDCPPTQAIGQPNSATFLHVNAGGISWDDCIVDIFQDTVVDSLGNSFQDNFGDLFVPSGEADSGYGSFAAKATPRSGTGGGSWVLL